MPVNHAKEYLIFVHTGAVFLQLLARASNGCHSSNFENWCLKMKSRWLYHTYILWKIWVASWFSITRRTLIFVLELIFLNHLAYIFIILFIIMILCWFCGPDFCAWCHVKFSLFCLYPSPVFSFLSLSIVPAFFPWYHAWDYVWFLLCLHAMIQ